MVGRAEASAGPYLLRQGDVAGAPAAEHLHLQFGADTSRSMVASWSTPSPVVRPRARIGTPDGGLGDEIPAFAKSYTDAMTGEQVTTLHAPMTGLSPDTTYIYEALADGAPPVAGSFRTAPVGRAPFRFTSFGDQAIPAPVGPGGLVGPSTPFAAYVVDAVENQEPLFHLLNGDLCYANVSDAPVDTWRSFWANNTRSARNRPWMPAAGNHENEVGNGPQGFAAYQTWFQLPDNGQPSDWQGNWYSFKVGSVGVVSINNDDVCYQAGSFSKYRRDRLRPERSHAVRGASHDHRSPSGKDLLTPLARSSDLTTVDTRAGGVHMILGGGGHSLATPPSSFDDPQHGVVIYDVGAPAQDGTRAAKKVLQEPSGWSAVRDLRHEYGYGLFEVDPGDPGGTTTITFTYMGNIAGSPDYEPYDRVVLRRPRGGKA